MPMKFNVLFLLVFLAAVPTLQAAPQFWDIKDSTPTPIAPPQVQGVEDQPGDYQTATPTPVLAPQVEVPTPTPTPEPGVSPKNPTQAVIFSAILPGSGQVYAGDPVKGLVFATLFGVSLWQTIDNLQLVNDGTGNLVSKNETAGNLFGLGALLAYGFGIEDAFNTTTNYNKQHHLTLGFGLYPRPNASLAFRF